MDCVAVRVVPVAGDDRGRRGGHRRHHLRMYEQTVVTHVMLFLFALAQMDGYMRQAADSHANEVSVSRHSDGMEMITVVVCGREVHAGDERWCGCVHEFDAGE